MDIRTHKKMNHELCGNPIELKDGFSRVELKTMDEMAVDDTGLVHGGFVFGQADYAAMIAVNHPNVVLGAANVKFLKPVRAGQITIAEARVEEIAGKKQKVNVTVECEGHNVFEGEFVCFTLEKHVLET